MLMKTSHPTERCGGAGVHHSRLSTAELNIAANHDVWHNEPSYDKVPRRGAVQELSHLQNVFCSMVVKCMSLTVMVVSKFGEGIPS